MNSLDADMATTAGPDRRELASRFWRFWAASSVSNLGSAVSSVALPLIAVTELHASAWSVSLITAATYAAWIVIGLPAGVIVARLPLRRTQVVLDLVRAVAIGSIPLAWWLGGLTLAQLVVAALVISLSSVLFDVGNATFMPSVVGPDQLNARNGLMSATYSVNEMGGPSLGGLLVQLVGGAPTLMVDALSYLVSAVLLRGLPRAEARRPGVAGAAVSAPSMAEQIREGWHFVLRHPVMRPCALVATSGNFVCGALMALTPIYLVRDLAASPGLVGVLVATEGIGTLLGASVNHRLSARWGTARAVLVGELAGAALLLLLPVGSGVVGLLLFAVGNAGFAVGTVIGSINFRTHRQVVSPPELLSRVMATVRFISWGVMPFGALAAGGLATLTSPHTALRVFVVLNLISPAMLWLSPIRGRRDLA
jgi:MFS family permease